MLTIPRNGIDVLSAPPPSADVPDNPKHRQLMYIALNDEILAQIAQANGKGLSVTFGGTNAVSPSSLLSSAFSLIFILDLRARCVLLIYRFSGQADR